MIAWHYTTQEKLVRIAADGKLIPNAARIPKHGRPAVWFSIREDWEPTASKPLYNNGEEYYPTPSEMAEAFGGLARVGLDAVKLPLRWKDYEKHGETDRATFYNLRKIALRHDSNLADWRVSFAPILSENWKAIEISANGTEWKVMNSKEEKSFTQKVNLHIDFNR